MNSEIMIVITSDHVNIESVDERGHTLNLVPSVVIGNQRQEFSEAITDLTGFAPAILEAFDIVE